MADIRYQTSSEAALKDAYEKLALLEKMPHDERWKKMVDSGMIDREGQFLGNVPLPDSVPPESSGKK